MYKFVFASIDTPVDEIEKFLKKNEVPHTLKNNGVFIMNSPNKLRIKNVICGWLNVD